MPKSGEKMTVKVYKLTTTVRHQQVFHPKELCIHWLWRVLGQHKETAECCWTEKKFNTTADFGVYWHSSSETIASDKFPSSLQCLFEDCLETKNVSKFVVRKLKNWRKQRRELQQTKGLMSRTIASQVRYKLWYRYISLPCSTPNTTWNDQVLRFWKIRTTVVNFLNI